MDTWVFRYSLCLVVLLLRILARNVKIDLAYFGNFTLRRFIRLSPPTG